VRFRRVSLALAVGLLFTAPRAARACGSSGPDGVSACSLADYAEEQRPKWRVGASAVYTSTVIAFSGASGNVGETRAAILADLAYAPTARLDLHASLGSAIGGRILAPDGVHDFAPGLAVGAGVSYRFLDGETPLGRGFLVGTLDASFTFATTQQGDTGPSTYYSALDFRAGLAAGFTWLRSVSAYVVGRGFGGPVFWSDPEVELGTDTHHYQLGGGLAVLIARRVDLHAEGVPLGEQAVSGGVSVAF
jgi:hypothetical protein